MGCGSCGKGGGSSSGNGLRGSKIASVAETCDYNISQVEDWLQKITCYKDKQLYQNTKISKRILNKYISTLMASKHHVNNVCYFKKKLKEIETFITVVISTGQC
jgi:hypothetical protein